MSLISRLEVTNYLTEGIEAHRRVVDWKPMLTGITLRMDGGRSALINITNGGGKTSLVELLLYLLSRDARLLKRIREKVAPKSRGYTHARIEFRTPPEDSYVAPSLLEIDPQNQPGETHVIGVALNDDVNDPPIFYAYSGTLEDSPCYCDDGMSIVSVANDAFVARTRALYGCKWNKFGSRREWEDHIRLFLPVEVIRRNVIYQLKGSDDKNASFFDFTPRPGESYDSAFFRSVVAPDLLSNLLSSFSEEDESAVEDTLLKSLTRIVDAERVIVRKEHRLRVREDGITRLHPIMDAGRSAQALKGQRDEILRGLRKDIAFLWHFGVQGRSSALPGIPRRLPGLGDQDPRILVALKGMVISRDDGVLLLDQALSELSGVEVRVLTQAADRKHIANHPIKSQVIDFNCDFENIASGSIKGGHYRKGYPRDAALAMPDAVAGISGAKVAGLKELLAKAFDIAERQIDTNPAAHQVRQLQATAKQQKSAQAAAEKQIEICQGAIGQLELQVKDRQENQGAWEDFVKIGQLLPEEHRLEPAFAGAWIETQQTILRKSISERSGRRGELNQAWTTYCTVLEHHGLEGLEGATARLEHLETHKAHIHTERQRIVKSLAEASRAQAPLQGRRRPLSARCDAAATKLADFERRALGLGLYAQLFGTADPAQVNPVRDLALAVQAVQIKGREIRVLTDEDLELASLRSRAQSFARIFGEATDPRTCDPQAELQALGVDLGAARESMASLLAPKEAIEHFLELLPGDAPAAWIARADQDRERLAASTRELGGQRLALRKELEALAQMRSVEDGAFEQAWDVLETSGWPAQRLHQVVLNAGLPSEQCNDVLSALSGLLSTPVFDSLEDLQSAACALQAEGVAAPLVLRAELFSAIERGVDRTGDTRLIGFIGGNTSRRVRILLDPEFAEAERIRIEADLGALDDQLALAATALVAVEATSDMYQLALRARSAVEQRALERYLESEKEASRLELRQGQLKPQTTPTSLEVLHCAQAFITKGGDARKRTIGEALPSLKTELEKLQEVEGQAKERASQQGLNARDDALAYQQLGGSAGHAAAETDRQRLRAELEELDAQIEETQHLVEGLTEEQVAIDQRAQAFDAEGGQQELERYQVAIRLSGDTEAVEFMTHFETQQQTLDSQLNALIEASSVNFRRAQAFKANQGKSDQALQTEIAGKRQEIIRQTAIKTNAENAVERINGAEIPSWTRLAKAVHELAYEVGSRVARTRRIAAQASELEEGEAVAEVHPAYRQAEALTRTLQSGQLEAFGQLVDEVDGLARAVQDMNLEEGIRNHQSVAAQFTTALKKYTDLNTAFCDAAQAQADSSVTAFNALEIDEIRKATPETMRALMNLFEQLQVSLDKERLEAEQAKRVAEDTSTDTMAQLTRLIVSAEDNLETLNKVMHRYPNGRFFFDAQINKGEAVLGLINELKEEVELATRQAGSRSRSLQRTDETQLKRLLRDRLIQCVFTNTSVEFVNAGIWAGKKSHVSEKLSTGQKIALEFMWIVRQAEYEIERGLQEMTSKQAAKSRAKANRVILIDGIFSTLSDRKIIGEAMNGLRNLGGNFQIVGFLHSPTWNNDYSIFPVYHVGKKMANAAGDGLVSFKERGREPGAVGFFSAITKPQDPDPGSDS